MERLNIHRCRVCLPWTVVGGWWLVVGGVQGLAWVVTHVEGPGVDLLPVTLCS